MQQVDRIIHAGYLIPVEPSEVVLTDYAVVIHQGQIVALLPSVEVESRYRATTTDHRPHHLLIPGLINSHTHAAMSLMRGLADDLPLMRWLNEHIWPAEAKWISEAFVRDGTELAIAEMIRGGTTCFNDMYFFPEITAAVAESVGMRAVVGLIVIDFPTAWAADSGDYIAKGLALQQQLHGNPLITTAFAPHSPYTVSNAPLEQIARHAADLQLPIHIHLHETEDEIHHNLNHYGQRPIARLDQLGLLTPRTLAVHMTQLEAAEIERIGQRGTHVVHCPESNLKLASGFTPIVALQQQGVNIALGTDGAASNNNLDLIGEIRTAALLAKGVSRDAAALPAHQALAMATIHGAQALGMADRTGSITVGKAADLVAIDLDTLESQPLYHPISQLVYATDRSQVTDVWIQGEPLLQQRQLTRIDHADLLKRTRSWQQRLRANS